MTPISQTVESIRSDFDRIASLPSEAWNHNSQYHRYLLSHLPAHCDRVFEIGCGAGEFSRVLATRAANVMAIDLSPQMIRMARQTSSAYSNIDYVIGDAMTRQFPENYFDCIATLTTLHHLPAERILPKLIAALKPGGVLLCLDLYQRATPTDLLFDSVAYPVSLIVRLAKTGQLRPSKELREAYEEHGKSDRYLTLKQVRELCAEILPGAIVKRHLFWRYSIVWTKTQD